MKRLTADESRSIIDSVWFAKDRIGGAIGAAETSLAIVSARETLEKANEILQSGRMFKRLEHDLSYALQCLQVRIDAANPLKAELYHLQLKRIAREAQ